MIVSHSSDSFGVAEDDCEGLVVADDDCIWAISNNAAASLQAVANAMVFWVVLSKNDFFETGRYRK
jgi:hypothetical protein